MIGTTQSLCPECLEVVTAKIITKGNRVYFRKWCPTHGQRDDFVCSDYRWWDLDEGHTPSVLPHVRATETRRGCPYDCGLCPEHEQHTCIGLVELSDSCNLTCPMCFASSEPTKSHHSLDSILHSLDHLVRAEGRAEVCQLSGGEPTLHPDFEKIVDAALARPIDYVMVNTNGIRISKDQELVDFLAERHERVEIYLQFDGLDREYCTRLRGIDLVDIKLRALEKLNEAGLNCTLVATLTSPLPAAIYEDILQAALANRCVTGVSLQPATYSGRHLTAEDLENRVTYPDCIRGLSKASGGMLQENDFTPLPCAHPNCHQILIAARKDRRLVPLNRFAEVRSNLDLLAGGISFTRSRSKELIEAFVARATQCGSDCGCGPQVTSLGNGNPRNQNALPQVNLTEVDRPSEMLETDQRILEEFFARVIQQEASAKDILRITITSFLDIYNFDLRQAMKCCTHHVLPSGHIIPFCTYNSLYRPGHLPLPPLAPSPIISIDAPKEGEKA